jgi:hypothetical protein
MYSITYRFFINLLTENSVQAYRPSRLTASIILCDLLLLGVALMLFISLPAVTWASEQPDTVSYEKLDTRLLPWVGSWRLVSNKVNSSESELVEEFLLTIGPDSNENSITMKGYRDETPLVEEVIIVDGLRHQLTDDKCTGWYQYSWSENGKRLLLNSESTCPGDPLRIISGMSIIDENGDWLDIQLLRNGKQKAINIRKYHNVDNESVTLSVININRISSSRSAAGENFSINEIIELSSKVDSAVLEAALLEMGKPFAINSKKLIHMEDSKVPSRVIDLMVALSFPEKFIVEGDKISLAQGEGYRNGYIYFQMPYHYCSYSHSFFPWHWASSTCVPCGYSYLGWYGGCDIYYPFWAPPYYTGGGSGGREINNGRLIGGHGYTSKSSGSSSRRARPRFAPATQRSRSSTTNSSSRSSSSSSSRSSNGSSSGSSNDSESVTSSAHPSASPSGYSRGSR